MQRVIQRDPGEASSRISVIGTGRTALAAVAALAAAVVAASRPNEEPVQPDPDLSAPFRADGATLAAVARAVARAVADAIAEEPGRVAGVRVDGLLQREGRYLAWGRVLLLRQPSGPQTALDVGEIEVTDAGQLMLLQSTLTPHGAELE